ncbi:hypothetical protein BROUX41_003374 [Berkeleyomyces rouxiae]|uniref:uncharacterized protein n=1 Tax=Berkeleyomyces rouxiae TaxID=2035830 RepID=UPI003B7EE8B8
MSARGNIGANSLALRSGAKEQEQGRPSQSGLGRSNTVVMSKSHSKSASTVTIADAGAGAGNKNVAQGVGAGADASTGVTVNAPAALIVRAPTNSSLDPLSEHILQRTSTNDHSHPHPHIHSQTYSSSTSHSRNHPISHATSASSSKSVSRSHASRLSRNSVRSEHPSLEFASDPDSTTRSQVFGGGSIPAAALGPNVVFSETSREKKRSSSFFNRLSMIGLRRKEDSVGDGETSDSGDHRLDGARILMSPDASGFIPHHKEPVKYQRIKSNCKRNKEFSNLFLAQELSTARDAAANLKAAREPRGSNTVSAMKSGATVSGAPVKPARPELTSHDGAVWCMEFSQDGKYLAAAGQDGIVRVYAVLANPDDRDNEEDTTPDPSNGERLRAPVFMSKPAREFSGHEGEVLDLTWSKNGFLLSSSMDKTVRLWHMDFPNNLCVFQHRDFVTSIAFHPRDDRFFLAGSLDSILRLWSIPDKAVAFSATVPDMITAVAFSPDGQTSIAGMLHGLCMFFETEGLNLQKEIHVRSSRGRNAKGSKITGIETLETPSYRDGEVKVLITSNDSRIRQYNLRDKSLDIKLKGHENVSSQIHSRLSDDGQFVICGSEDKKVFIWPTSLNDGDAKDKRPLEYFEAHDDIVTVAMFAPTSTRRLVGSSDDPIYDLCNPPPIRLISREEASASQTSLSQATSTRMMKPEESPAYIARSAHNDGNIIVTSDKSGIIRVWRQDCAAAKRRHENLSSHRLSTLTRTGSIMTRTSFGSSTPYSRRGSISHLGSAAAAAGGGVATAGDGSAGKSPQLNSDIIDSWRYGVLDSPDAINSTAAAHGAEPPRTPTNLDHMGQAQVLTPPSSEKAQQYENAIDDSPSSQQGGIPTSELTSSELASTDNIDTKDKRNDPQEGFIESFFSRWRGRQGPIISSVAAAAMAAIGNGNAKNNGTEPTNASTETEGVSHVDGHDEGAPSVEDTRSPTPPTPTVGVQRPSFDEDNLSDTNIPGTTPTLSNVHLLSPKARARRRHSVGPRTFTDSVMGARTSKTHDLVPLVLEPRPQSAHSGSPTIVPAITVAGSNTALQHDNDETDGNETLGSSCAGCGRCDFYMRKIGGRPRLLCSGCGMLVSENQRF